MKVSKELPREDIRSFEIISNSLGCIKTYLENFPLSLYLVDKEIESDITKGISDYLDYKYLEEMWWKKVQEEQGANSSSRVDSASRLLIYYE